MINFSKYLLLAALFVTFAYILKSGTFKSGKFPSKQAMAKFLPSEKVIPVKKITEDVKRGIASVVDGTDDAKTKAMENQPGARIAIGESYYKGQNYGLALPYFTEELRAIKTGDTVYGNKDQVVHYLQSRIADINQKMDE